MNSARKAGPVQQKNTEETVMKKLAAIALGLAAVAATATGCNSNKQAAGNKPPLRPQVTDISPTPPATYVAPQPVQPVQPVTAIAPVAPEPAAAPAAAHAAGGSYTVQKGDTLYKIAREHYGDGKQWQRIAAANPGLSPNTIKVGQKLIIP
jgi:5'-nucleotidase